MRNISWKMLNLPQGHKENKVSYNLFSTIRHQLEDHGAISIKGLGTLLVKDQSAKLDYVTGRIMPPSQIISFQENRNCDHSEALVRTTMDAQQLTHDQALAWLDRFVWQFFQRIEEGDIIELPRIGRFYMEHDKHLVFYSSPLWSMNDLALPQMDFDPVLQQDPIETSTTEVEPEVPFLRKYALPLAASTILLMSTMTYIATKQPEPTPAGTVAILDTQEGLKKEVLHNQRPTAQPVSLTEEPIVEATEEVVTPSEEVPTPKKPTKKKTITPKKAVKPDNTPTVRLPRGSFVVITGSFESKRNSFRMIQQIESLGYPVYSDTSDGLIRVGAVLNKRDISYIQKELEYLSAEFGSAAWLLQL